MNFKIKMALPGDAATLSVLGEETFRDPFSSDNDPADMEAYIASAFGKTIQEEELRDSRRLTWLVWSDDEVLAYAQILRGQADPSVLKYLALPPSGSIQNLSDGQKNSKNTVESTDADLSTVELLRFYVRRDHHGQGLAQILMRHVLAESKSAGYEFVWLGVWENNLKAISFYRKFGFQKVGSHLFRLGKDEQTDDILLKTLISPEPESNK